MKLINCLLISAALLSMAAFAQSPAPKIIPIANLDANNDQVISKDEALKAGMPDATFKKLIKIIAVKLVRPNSMPINFKTIHSAL